MKAFEWPDNLTEEQKLELAFLLENGLMKTKEITREELMKLYPSPVEKDEK